METAVNGNTPQGDPPNQVPNPPTVPNGNNQPLAPPPALPHVDNDLVRAMQALQLQQQVFQQQQQDAQEVFRRQQQEAQEAFRRHQQEAFQQQQLQITHLTSIINGLTAHAAQGPNVPNIPGGPLQNGSNTASPLHVPHRPTPVVSMSFSRLWTRLVSLVTCLPVVTLAVYILSFDKKKKGTLQKDLCRSAHKKKCKKRPFRHMQKKTEKQESVDTYKTYCIWAKFSLLSCRYFLPIISPAL